MDKKALQEQFEEFARWYVLPLDKSEDGIYRALETQSAWAACQHQQAKVEEMQTQLSLQRQRMKDFEEELTSSRNYGDELQKRLENLEKLKDVYRALSDKELDNCTEGLLKHIERLEMLEQALKGEGL
ncbi:hypothetical protein [Acinetobacter nosocomialis]|uniref:hypothetical protein n=1 Tax=Acinetobacter nosocomialis TaxID=106654 RepID=UPI000678587E|nr:hypothetical protein [Acinetobacter nosocomialis]